jgi:hypothetical protein
MEAVRSLILFPLVTVALWYLLSFATVTAWLHARLPWQGFRECPACSGFWYGAVANALGHALGWSYLGLPCARGFVYPLVMVGSLFWTAMLARLLLSALTFARARAPRAAAPAPARRHADGPPEARLMSGHRDPKAPYWVALDEAERKIVLDCFQATGFHVANSANLLGVTRQFLSRRARELGILPPGRPSEKGPRAPKNPRRAPAPPPAADPPLTGKEFLDALDATPNAFGDATLEDVRADVEGDRDVKPENVIEVGGEPGCAAPSGDPVNAGVQVDVLKGHD